MSFGHVDCVPSLKRNSLPLKIDPWNLGDSELGNHHFLGGELLRKSQRPISARFMPVDLYVYVYK